jgi:hypothetical protein
MVGVLRKFELINTMQFKLPRDPDTGNVATHLATIQWGMREFIYFRLDSTGQTFIEEVILRPTVNKGKIVAKYLLIEDDNLWHDLAGFLTEKGLTDMKFPYHNPFV